MVFLAAAALGAACVGWKVGQATGDEDFGTVEYPAWFRRELIAIHIKRHGYWCGGYNRPAHNVARRKSAFQVDHIIPLAHGGRTSRANAQVLCQSCNASKGASYTFFDQFRGRYE